MLYALRLIAIIYVVSLCILMPKSTEAMLINARKLDCIPELNYYKFGSPVLLSYGYFGDDIKDNWEKHLIVLDTVSALEGDEGWAYQDDWQSELDKSESLEYTCPIKDGIKTIIKARGVETMHGIGATQAQIQLYYGDNLIINIFNEYGCYDFQDTACRHFRSSVLDLSYINHNIIMKTAIRASVIERDYGLQDESEKPEILSDTECKVYYLDLSMPLDYFDDSSWGKRLISTADGNVIEYPITLEDIKQILIEEYEAERPRYYQPHHYEPDDPCHFEIWAR